MITTLRKILLELLTSSHRPFTLQELSEAVAELKASKSEIALVLGDLIRTGQVSRSIHIKSPVNGQELGNFENLDNIPHSILDPATGEMIEIKAELLNVQYISRFASQI